MRGSPIPNLANALFQTACHLGRLPGSRKRIVALRIKGKGCVFHDVPVPERLSAALVEWKDIQESFKVRRIMAPGGIAFAGSEFVCGIFGAPLSRDSSSSKAAKSAAASALTQGPSFRIHRHEGRRKKAKHKKKNRSKTPAATRASSLEVIFNPEWGMVFHSDDLMLQHSVASNVTFRRKLPSNSQT
jgi:hypothetical protein